MKTMDLRLIAGLLATAVLAACATATPYQPATDGYGYAEQRIENNRFRIVFNGNSETPRQTVETYLLYRAAELTLQSGYDYFVFASDSTDSSTRYLQSFSGYGGWGPYYWGPRSAFGGFGASTSMPITHPASVRPPWPRLLHASRNCSTATGGRAVSITRRLPAS